MFFIIGDYDKVIENSFERIFKGNKQELSSELEKIIQVLRKTFDKGFLSFKKLKSMEKLFLGAYDDHSCKVISYEDEEIVVLDEEEGRNDRFMLKDLLTCFVDELVSDPIFSKRLHGHFDYDGVMNAFREISKISDSSEQLEITDKNTVINKNSVVYLIQCNRKRGTIALIEIDKKKPRPFKPKRLMELSDEALFLDSENDYLYVNHADGFGRRMHYLEKTAEVLEGTVISLRSHNEILLKSEEALFLEKDGFIIEYLGTVDSIVVNLEEEEGTSWFNTKDGMFYWCKKGQMLDAHSLKANVVWRYILENAYTFKKPCKLSDRIRQYQCRKTPVPFSKDSILDQIGLLEQGLHSGNVKKTNKYSEIILPIMQLESEGMDITDELFDMYQIDLNKIRTVRTEAGVLKLPAFEDYFD